jgi:CheY-like chemotaxis protein
MTERPTILVVDDDPAIRALISLILQAHGYTSIEARDGEQALELLDRTPDVNLMLLDLRMPRMNGLELLAELRARAKLDSLPVVAFSGDGNAAREAIEAGARAVLIKPIEASRLLDAVRDQGLRPAA